jgi:hypothetical protein
MSCCCATTHCTFLPFAAAQVTKRSSKKTQARRSSIKTFIKVRSCGWPMQWRAAAGRGRAAALDGQGEACVAAAGQAAVPHTGVCLPADRHCSG